MQAKIAVLGYSGKTDLLQSALGDPQSPNIFLTTLDISNHPFILTFFDIDCTNPDSILPQLSDITAILLIYNFHNSDTFQTISSLLPLLADLRSSHNPPIGLLGHFSSETPASVSHNSVANLVTQFRLDFSSEISPLTFPFAVTKLIHLRFDPIGEFIGKTVVVTGGAQGIGKCVSLEFAKRGATVYVADINQTALSIIESESRTFSGRIHPIICDVALESDCQNLATAASSNGFIHILINNAGIGRFNDANIFDSAMEGFDRVIAVNLRGTFMCAKFCSLHMPEGSAIVNIASTRALQSEAKTEGYSASKGGIVALTHAMSLSLAEKKIRVNAISPGWIDVSTWRPDGEQEKFTSEDLTQHPVGRVGVPQDIAEMCIFLASPRAGFITGQNHVVDGGMTKKMIYV
jgi:NAD(P)-dependent dehydrogenase (short-subunit alcohol dehydrogenase family)